MKATKAELRKEIAALRWAGTFLANIAYNLAQDSKIEERHRQSMRESYKLWDDVKRAER